MYSDSSVGRSRNAGGSRTHLNRVAAGRLAVGLQRFIARGDYGERVFQSSSLKVVVAIDAIKDAPIVGSNA